MVEIKNIIAYNKTLLEALGQLSNLSSSCLVLFVVDEDGRMVGTLTDGDSRRALVAGASVHIQVEKIMHRDFHYLMDDSVDKVQQIRSLREMGMKMIPVLDRQHRIADVINLQKFKSRLPIDAVLMAGGKGERLRPLTETTPKPLLKVGNKAIIDYNIDNLISFGVSHINVTINYLGQQIKEYFKDPRDGIKINCVREPQYLGTIGSIKFIDTFYNDTILLMNSDLFTNIDLEDFFLHFKQNNADMSVAAIPYSVSVPYGIFELEEYKIKGVKEKPTYNYYANSGIYLIKRKLLKLIPDGVFYNATDFMERLIREGFRVIRFPLVGYWIDIGKHEDYRKAQEFAKHL